MFSSGKSDHDLVRRARLAVGLAAPARALTIQFIDRGGFAPSTPAYTALRAAAALWENAFSDHVTVRISVGTSSTLASNILANTSSAMASTTTAATESIATISSSSRCTNWRPCWPSPAASTWSIFIGASG